LYHFGESRRAKIGVRPGSVKRRVETLQISQFLSSETMLSDQRYGLATVLRAHARRRIVVLGEIGFALSRL